MIPPHLEKESEMTDNNIVNAEIEEAPKESIVKKALRHPKKLAIGAGIALATVAGVIWFAVKRSDEADFEDEFPSDIENSVEDATV